MDVITKAYNYICQLKEKLADQNYVTTNIEQKNYNYEFTVKVNNKKIKVLVYFGKKGIKTVLQGDVSSKEFSEIRELIFEQMELNLSSDDNDIKEPDEYIGTDESGKGDFFGPLVVAAVYVNNETKKKLKQLGVRDSKVLSDEQISCMTKNILKIIGENYSIVTITPSKYNQLYNEFKNLNKLLSWAHSKAIENILKKNKCKKVITDKFSNQKLKIYFDTNYSSVEFLQITKAEKYIGVAAASILARNKFNEWFNSQSKKGINLVKGSSKKVEESAIDLIGKIGKENLSKYAKLHFKTLKKVI